MVYFANDKTQYTQNQLRIEVGQKKNKTTRIICYCFDVNYETALNDIDKQGNSEIKEFVIQQTVTKQCACEVRNPSGKCCLSNFPK